jgi:hypothetical protein
VSFSTSTERRIGYQAEAGLKAKLRVVPVIFMTVSRTPPFARPRWILSASRSTKPFSVQALMEPLKKASAGRS